MQFKIPTVRRLLIISNFVFGTILCADGVDVLRIGGLPSCQSEVRNNGDVLVPDYGATQFDQFLSDLKKKHQNIHVTYACFGPPMLKLIASRGRVDFRFQEYLNSSTHNIQNLGRNFVAELNLLNEGKIPEGLKSFFQYMRNVKEQKDPHKTIVIGSSYGAWLAIQLVAKENIDVDLLLTVDAISPVTCNVGTFMKNWKVIEPGCVTFPSDLATDTLEKVKGLTKVWINFYQKQFLYLRSTKTEFAHENKVMHFLPTNLVFNNYHARAMGSPVVWQVLANRLNAL